MIAVLCADACSGPLRDRLLADGDMPNLAALLAQIPAAQMRGPAPLFPAATFPSLYTGTSVAEHGVFYPFQWSAPRQRVVPFERFAQPPAIWERLAEAGGRALVVDPYEAVAPARWSGELISGWQMSERVILRRWSRPRALWARAALTGGRPAQTTEIFGATGEAERATLASRLLGVPDRVASLVERRLPAGDFDLAWINFAAAHLGGHRLWGRPELDAIHRATDEALGRVLAALPAGSDLVVVCPVGMEGESSRAELMAKALSLVLGEGEDRDDGVGGGGEAIWRIRAAVPARARGAVAGAMPGGLARRLTARLELRGTDWTRTRAFAHPSDSQGYVRLNLAGRERAGIVDPAAAEALLGEISAELAELTTPSGMPAVEEIVRTAERVDGPHLDRLPDLVVRWAPAEGEDRSVLVHPRLGSVRRIGPGSGRSGNHPADGGWVVAAGLAPSGADASIEDVAATVAARLGLDPAGLSGSSLLDRAPSTTLA